MIAEEIEKLANLRDAGTLTDAEFEEAKSRLLRGQQPPPPPLGPSATGTPGLGMDTNSYCMLLHLSQFAAFAIPVAGIVAPIVLWSIGKDKDQQVDAHGRVVLNWLISEFIYGIVCFLLVFVLIGIPMGIALTIIGIVFPIIGAVKANSGELWPYPLSIHFLGAPTATPSIKVRQGDFR